MLKLFRKKSHFHKASLLVTTYAFIPVWQ